MAEAVAKFAELKPEVEREIRDWALKENFSSASAVVAVGFAGGLLPQVVRERSPVPIIGYDPRIGGNAPVADWPNVMAFRDLPALRIALRAIHRKDRREPVMIHFDSADPELTEEQETVKRIWHEATFGCAMEHRAARFSNLYRTVVFLKALKFLVDRVPINHVRGACKGMPAICVGGGPSFDKQVDAVRAVQDRALIIGVNTSAPALLEAGIRADVIVTCEAKAAVKWMPAEATKDAIIVPGLHVHDAVWELPALRVCPSISSEGLFGTWLTEQMGVIPIEIGGSAGTLSAGVALALGCDPIILVGHDCCSDPETGQLYSQHAQWAGTTVELDGETAILHKSDAKAASDESVFPGRERTQRDAVTHVPNWDESGEVLCNGPYDSLRQWWEEAAVQLLWSQTTKINASVGGARLWGWESKRIEDLELPECDPRKALLAALDAAEGLPRATMRKALEVELEHTRKARELYAEGAKLAKRLREIQLEAKELGPKTDLLESYTWGQFETDIMAGDKEPIFDRMGVLLDDLSSGAETLDDLLSDCLKEIA